MTKYVYQLDDGVLDKISDLFESRVGDNTGDHEEDYNDLVKLLLWTKSQGSLLDVGAGAGRLAAVAKKNYVAYCGTRAR